MAEVLSIISLVSFIVSGLCFVLAVFFWFFFKIPSVIGDLSGRTARKSIAKMRANNEITGNENYKSNAMKSNRRKNTGAVNSSRKTEKAKKKTEIADKNHPETGLLKNNKARLKADVEATGLLNEEEGTAMLNNVQVDEPKNVAGVELLMLDDIMLIHTDEVI
ncbi:MAG: hypothetical protein UIM53_00085 [Acutalibacteraceae bacterium]|nr:hypothetical protein [Acutalibacteraceae bacterium]